MVIKRPYATLLFTITHPIDPFHEKESSLPLMIEVRQIRYQSQGSPKTHKVVKALGSRDLLGFVAIEKLL